MERKVFGVIYERFFVGRKLSSFGMKRDIKTVLEMLAHGAKAMPSIYSLGFGTCAQKITLANGNPKYISERKKIGVAHKIEQVRENDILQGSFQDKPYDFVWNFAYLPACPDPGELIEEMKRISKKYVAVLSANTENIGFLAYRLVYKKTGTSWIHGDIRYNKRGFVRKRLEEYGLTIVETGFVDCPVWPDSLGFRDVRLHRMNVDFNTMDWKTPHIQMLAQNRFPLWVKLVHPVKKLLMPKKIKSIHSHINYTITKVGKQMKKQDLSFILGPGLTSYRLNHRSGYKDFQPITLTYSVTAACQLKCKTCQIGVMLCQGPSRAKKDLRLDETRKIFKNMGPAYFFNISDGEPFLRPDLPEIVELACKYTKPRVVHIPTNGIMVERIAEYTEKTIRIVRQYDKDAPVTVKPSIGGVEKLHDETRGVEGSFNQLLKTIVSLKRLEDRYGNFHLELGTVASNFNIDYPDETEGFIHGLGVENYRNEMVECRTEPFDLGDDIIPPTEVYQKLIKEFVGKVEGNIGSKKLLAKTTEALCVVYYEIAGKILETGKQVIPCYVGVSSVHINYDGGVWSCCALGYEKEMGNLRDYEHDFQKLWRSPRVEEVRAYIKSQNCACPSANQGYSNILMHVPSLAKAGRRMLEFSRK